MEGRGDGGSESGGESGWRRWEGGGGGRVRREGKKGGRRKNDAPIYQDLLEYVSSNGGTSIRWLKREESDIDG